MSPSKPARPASNTVYLSLGSNLGDRHQSLAHAIAKLSAATDIRVTKQSPLYETKPVGLPNQPDFLNQALEIQTTLTPHALLETCLEIEFSLGRPRSAPQRTGSRTIDIDILLFGTTTCSDERLTLPHPRMHERAFVLAPLADIAPDLLINTIPIHHLLSQVTRQGIRCLPS